MRASNTVLALLSTKERTACWGETTPPGLSALEGEKTPEAECGDVTPAAAPVVAAADRNDLGPHSFAFAVPRMMTFQQNSTILASVSKSDMKWSKYDGWSRDEI